MNNDDILTSLMRDLNDLQDDIKTNSTAIVMLDEMEDTKSNISDNKDNNDDDDTVVKKKRRRNMCSHCHIEMVNFDALWRTCPKCKAMIKIHGHDMENCDSMSSYNSIADSSVPARIIGNGMVKTGLNRCLLQSSVDSRKQRRSKILTGISQIIFGSGINIPAIYLEMAVDAYCDINKRSAESNVKFVYRGAGQRSMLAGFVEHICLSHSIRIPTAMLAKAFEITETDISKAKGRISNLVDRGLARIEKVDDKCKITLQSFISKLKVDQKYVPFLHSLILRAENKNLHLLESTTEKTKCAGAIYLLTTCIKDLAAKSITPEKIKSRCGVTIPTFTKYYNLLMAHKTALKKVFKKSSIPMPLKWKPKVQVRVQEPKSDYTSSESDEES